MYFKHADPWCSPTPSCVLKLTKWLLSPSAQQVPLAAGERADSRVHSGAILQTEVQPSAEVSPPTVSAGRPGAEAHVSASGGEKLLWEWGVSVCGGGRSSCSSVCPVVGADVEYMNVASPCGVSGPFLALPVADLAGLLAFKLPSACPFGSEWPIRCVEISPLFLGANSRAPSFLPSGNQPASTVWCPTPSRGRGGRTERMWLQCKLCFGRLKERGGDAR